MPCKRQNEHVTCKRNNALTLWHKQQSTIVSVHRPLITKVETMLPERVGVSYFTWLAALTILLG